MTIDVSEGVPYSKWAPLPDGDRVVVGGHTVWTGPFRPPVVVPQPNRWGIVEDGFPDVECLVEADPVVTGVLALPDRVVGFLDRAHRPLDPPRGDPSARQAIGEAARVAKSLAQSKGVRVVATPFARTVPLVTPRDSTELIRECEAEGVIGLRPLPGLAGGLALSVRADHSRDQLHHLVATIRGAVGR